MSCTIKESVQKFKNAFEKKIVGNSKTVKLSNGGATVIITPSSSSKNVNTSDKAYRMAEKQIKALDALSKEYLGLRGGFRPGKIEVSPDGIVSYNIRPPFNMYRELLKKKESVEKLEVAEAKRSQEKIENTEKLKKDVEEVLPEGSLKDFIVQGLQEEVQEEKNLFNYSQEVIDELAQDSYLNDYPLPEEGGDALYNLYDDMQEQQEESMETLFGNNVELVSDKVKEESLSSYAGHLIRYKEKLIERLQAKRKVLLEDLRATDEVIEDAVREKYLSDVNTIDSFIQRNYKDIKALKTKKEDIMIDILKKEIADIYTDLQGSPEEILSAIANKNLFSRIELLEKFIPSALSESSKDYDESFKEFFETAEYGDYKGGLSFAFTENPNIVASLKKSLVQIRASLNNQIDNIILEMVSQNSIFLSKMSDVRGDASKLSMEDFKKLLETELRDLNIFEANLTSIIENDSSMEEYLARAELLMETRTEHTVNKNMAKKAQESYDKAISAVEGLISSGRVSAKGRTPRQVLSDMMYDRASLGKKIIDKFSSSYNRLLGDLKAQTKAIKLTNGLEAEQLFIKKMQTIALQHDVIKPHMLRVIKERIEQNPNMQNKLVYFDGVSEQEMDEYEKELREKLGYDFDRQVDKIYNSLLNWEFTENAALTGVVSQDLKRIYEDSPWDFAKNFDSLTSELELGITSNIYTEYENPNGEKRKTFNNPPLRNMFLIPKGNPQDNPGHFNQDFERDINSNQDIYNAWRDISEYINEYSIPRLGQKYNTITRARKDSLELLAAIKNSKDKVWTGMNVQSLKNLFNFLFDSSIREKFSRSGVHYQNSNGITSHFSNESLQDIELRTKSIIAKYTYDELRKELQKEGVETYISEADFFVQKKNDPAYKVIRTQQDTDATFAKKSANMQARIAREYFKLMARSLATQEIHAAFNTDVLENAMAQGNMAALQRGNEKALSTVKMLQSFMQERNLRGATETQGNRKVSKRRRADKRFNTWIETDIKNNRKGLNKTIVREPDTGDFELDAELAQNSGNRDEQVKASNALNRTLNKVKDIENYDPKTTVGKFSINILRRFKFYEEAQKDYLNTLQAILDGKLQTPDFSFRILEDIDGIVRNVTYTTDYDEEGNLRYIKKHQVKKLDDNGAEQISTETFVITENDYAEALGTHYTSAAARMGRDLTMAGFLNNLGATFSYTSLAFSAFVGTKNRLEGKNSGALESERQGKEQGKAFRSANHFMSGYNAYRVGSKNKENLTKGRKAQFRTLDLLAEELDIFQDRKDFIQRMSNAKENPLLTAFGAGIDLPERKNQLPFLIKNASEMLVKDKDGNQVAVFGNGEFQIYIPGTLKLKPEFREGPEGKKNIEIWENFGANIRVRGQANPIHDLIAKTTADIINSQGNFSDQDTLAVFQKPLGSLLLLFNRWFGSRMNRMFISKKYLNPITGMEGVEATMGAKRIFSSAPLIGGYGALLALQTFTPGVAGTIALSSMITGAMVSAVKSKINGGELKPSKEYLIESAALTVETLARTINFPMQFFRSSKNLNFIDSEWYGKISPLEKALKEDKISLLQANRVRVASASLATSLGMSLSFLGLRMALNSTLIDHLIDNLTAPDDDDDEEELQRKRSLEFTLYVIQNTLGYGIENVNNNLQSAAFGEFNFINFIKDRSSLPLLGSLVKMQREIDSFGDDGYNDNDSSFLTSTLAVLNALGISSVPSILGNTVNFYSTEGKEGRIGFMHNKVYMPGSWSNKAFIESQMTSEDVIRNLFNKNGYGLRNKIKKVHIDRTADEAGIWFNSFDNRYDSFISAADEKNKYLSKKSNETYLEMAIRIRKMLESDKTLQEDNPDLIKKLDEEIAHAQDKFEAEEAFKEKYYSEGQKSNENYDPSKKYKATKEEIEFFNQKLQEYEDKIESSYK